MPRQRRGEKGPRAIIRDDRVALFIQTAGYSHIRPPFVTCCSSKRSATSTGRRSAPPVLSEQLVPEVGMLFSKLDLILPHSPSRAHLRALHLKLFIRGKKKKGLPGGWGGGGGVPLFRHVLSIKGQWLFEWVERS